MEIRFATLKDVDAILQLYDISLEKLSNKAKREFIREKIRQHILSPFSDILIAVETAQVVAFSMFTIDEKAFARYIRRPAVLLRVMCRLMTGRYGCNIKEILQTFKRAPARKRMDEVVNAHTSGGMNEAFCAPKAYLSAYATHPDYRGRGIASSLLKEMLSHLKEQGVERVWAEVHHLNKRSLHTLSKLGFQTAGMIRHPLEGTC